MDKFIEKLIEMLDCEDITINTSLDELEEWDSLSFVGFLAMANVEYGKKVLATDVRNAKTVADLYALIK